MESIILFLTMLILPIFYYRTIKEQSFKKIKEDLLGKWQGNKKEIIGGLALFGALLLGFVFLTIIINIIGFNDLELVEEVINESLSENVLLFVITVFFIVFAEEFFFRAFLVKRTGIWISTLLFTLAHIGYGSFAQLFGVFFLGLILAYWYKKNNSLFQNFLAHLLYNMFAIIIYLII
jgi:uncharacterized protein